MHQFQTILWDVDDTLLDFLKSEDFAIRTCFEKYGLQISREIITRYSEINLSFWKRLELGEVDKLTVLRERFVQLFRELGVEGIDIEAFRADYQINLGSVYFFLEESHRLLKELKDSGYRQFFVTNGVAWTQRNKLKLAGMDILIEDMFISEELGVEKPDPMFFERAFEKIPGFQKENTILIGDSLTSDMKGAANAGISSCWYNPGKKRNNTDIKTDYEIESLWQIKDILRG